MSVGVGKKISVCLITYNHVDVIESTIRSILNQSVTDYEILISDDQSNDGTWERIQSLAKTEPGITAIRTPHNLGMAGNANFAVARCSRPYVALLHHDDLYDTQLLEKWAALMEESPDVGFVFNQYRTFDTGNVDQLSVPARHFDGKWLLDNYFFSSWTSVVRGTAMIRREAWDQVGGMREQFELVADIDLWMRLSMAGPVGYVEDPLITVRQQRPDYYPEIYKSTHWSWRRQRLVYEIHAANRKEYYGRGFRAWLRWAAFRIALSLETTKWLCYSVIKGRQDMIRTSDESVTPYDLFPLRILRWIIQRSIRSDYRLSA